MNKQQRDNAQWADEVARKVRRADDALRNWGVYVTHGEDPFPASPDRCASAEREYRSTEIWNEEYAPPEPPADVRLGEIVEHICTTSLPFSVRNVLREHYVILRKMPLDKSEEFMMMIGARRLRMTFRDYEAALNRGRRCVAKALSELGTL